MTTSGVVTTRDGADGRSRRWHMITIVIILVHEKDAWQISRCAVNVGHGRIRSCPCPTRHFSSKAAAIETMKRRAMQYLRRKGYTDSPLDIEWHIALADPPDYHSRRRP